MKKKILNIILSLILVLTLIPTLPHQKVYAATGSVSISFDKSAVISGNQVVATVNISTANPMMVAEFNINYDTNALTFVSTTGPAATTAPSGVIPYQFDPNSPTSNLSFTITFKANAVGTGTVSMGDNTIVVDTLEKADLNAASASVNIQAVGSDDATLSNIAVIGGTLSPAFSKWTTNYAVYVDNSVTSIDLAATASQGGRIDVAGDSHNLKVGANYITFVCYAPNGASAKYVVNIVRAEPPTEPITYEAERHIKIDDTNTILRDVPDDMTFPEGFTLGAMNVLGANIKVAASKDGSVVYVYVMNEATEECRLMYYDQVEEKLVELKTIASAEKKYYILDMDSKFQYQGVEIGLCDNFEKTTYTFGEKEAVVYKFKDLDNIYIIKAITGAGELKYLLFDSQTGSIINYFEATEAEMGEVEVISKDELDKLQAKYDKLDKKYNKSMDTKKNSDNKYKIIIVVLVVVIIALCAALGLLFFRKKANKDASIDNSDLADGDLGENEEYSDDTELEDEMYDENSANDIENAGNVSEDSMEVSEELAIPVSGTEYTEENVEDVDAKDESEANKSAIDEAIDDLVNKIK